MLNNGPDVLNGIVEETVRNLIPYAADVQTAITSEIERTVYLPQITEGNLQTSDAWLMSTGTLRLVALLPPVLRNPTPAPLIVIEEIENGLDPRSVNLIMDEVRDLVQSGRSQVILTTHSPYLLDLVPLRFVLTVDRENGQPVFRRPSDLPELDLWKEKFTSGKLYTMGRLTKDQS